MTIAHDLEELDQFHDGSFQGFWIDGGTAHLQLVTDGKEPFTAVARGVVALSAGGFRAGSIVFEVTIREGEEISLDDIKQMHDLMEGPGGEAQGIAHLDKARRQALVLFEVSSSYGATCMLLAQSVELLPRHEWLQRYCTDSLKSPES